MCGGELILSRFPIIRSAERKFSYGLFGDADASAGIVYSEIAIKAPHRKFKIVHRISEQISSISSRFSDESYRSENIETHNSFCMENDGPKRTSIPQDK